jgi:hypothetical protein
MKFGQYFASLAIVALALSVGAFAKDSNSGHFRLSDAVQVGSTQLKPGNYKVEWNGPPNDVKVEIMQHGKTVATAQGKIQDLHQPAPYNAVVTRPANNDMNNMQANNTTNNMKKLSEIEFNNRSEALMIGS